MCEITLLLVYQHLLVVCGYILTMQTENCNFNCFWGIKINCAICDDCESQGEFRESMLKHANYFFTESVQWFGQVWA